MYTITLYLENKIILTYNSNILPVIGDVFAGIEFEDAKMKTVISRQLMTINPNSIVIQVINTFG